MITDKTNYNNKYNSNLFVQYKPNKLGWLYKKILKVCVDILYPG